MLCGNCSEVYADLNCQCQGQGIAYTYYQCDIMSTYFGCLLIHEFDVNGNTYDRHFSYGKCSSEDLCFWVMRVQDYSDGAKLLVPSRIIISDDTNINIYQDKNGGLKTYTFSQYSSNDKGNINNKYYFIDSSYSYMTLNESNDNGYEILYNSIPFSYIVESSNSYTDIVELAKWLCGEQNDSDLPDNVTVPPTKPIKDLEPPLNIKVDGINNNMFNNKQKSLKIRWDQSNIDLTDYETHFYFMEKGRTRKTIFNEWQDVDTPWLFDKKFITAKYCNNNLKYYEYKWWTDQSKLGDYANALLYGDEFGGLMCEHSAVDFMIRNEKIDDSGVQHYSNWVYVNCFNDGTYQVYEMNDDYTLDKDSDETGNIKTDSDIYDDEIIYDEKDFDSPGIGDASNFVDSMKDLISSLREFPNLFAKIFSFFPAWILALTGMLFVAVLLARLFL